MGARAPDPRHRPRTSPRRRSRAGAGSATARRRPARSASSTPPPAASATTARCGRRWPSATGALGNSTALVGTPETVAEALLDYVDLGVSTLLIRGYDPLDDAIDYGRELIPRVRAGVLEREGQLA